MIRYILIKIYSKINLDAYSTKRLLKYAFMQKILGFNRHIPWPVHWTSRIVGYENIQSVDLPIGFMPGCNIDGRNGIIIRKNVILAANVSVISMNHDVNDFKKYVTDKPILIGENSWIGTHVVILPGVKLGAHTIVAAGAIVTKSFPEGNQILAGNPAQVIKQIGDYSPQKA